MRVLTIILNVIVMVAGSVTCLILSAFPSISYPQEGDAGIAVLSLITIFLLFLIFASELVAAFRISDSTYHTVLLSLFILLYACFSPDTLSFWSWVGFPFKAPWVSEAASEVAFLAVMGTCFHLLFFTFRPGGKLFSVAPVLIAIAVSATLYGVLSIWGHQLIAHFIFVAFCLGYFILFQVECVAANADSFVYWLICLVFSSAIGMHTTNMLFFTNLIPNVTGWSIGYLWLIMLSFVTVYLSFILRVEKQAVRAEEFKRQAEILKTNMLVKQFKPHFVSNALMMIKTTYHRDMDEGDRAIWLFSNYMRDTVGLLKAGLVPFERELEFTMSYIDFVNVGKEDQFKVVFNIDYLDFSVPALSLQPYIENAIKYSKVNQKEDGCTTITSYLDGKYIYLKITDNGVGFDTEVRKEGSTGIENSSERFSILLDAKTHIESSEEGTIISIRIPKKEGEKQ